MNKFLKALFLVTGFATNINAQFLDTLYTDSLRINKLEEVEVRAMYSNIATRRFPATVYAYTPPVRNVLLPVNINEGLNRIPAVYAHTGTFNTSRITMRGIGSRSLYGTRKINALLNDIPLTSGEGDTFIDDIDLQFIDRIETIGGPTAGIYGPALGGTILLNTEPPKENSLFFNTGAASFGTFLNAIQAGFIKGASSVSVRYKRVDSDGYRNNNSYNRNSALVSFNYAQKKSVWSFLLLFTGVKAEIPSSIDSATFYNNPESAAANWEKTRGRENTQRVLGGITFQYNHKPGFSSFLTFYGLYKKSLEVRPFNYLNEDDKSGGVKFYFKKKFQTVEGLSITQGVSFFGEKYHPLLFENIGGIGEKGSKIADNIENIYQANAFLITDYVPNLKNYFTLSLNFNKFGFNDKNYFTQGAVQRYSHPVNFSPRISYSRQLIINHFVFGSISHGLSYPSMQEIIYPDGSINSDVKPENAWSFEGGFKGIQLWDEIKYSIAGYYMPVKDLIVPDRIAEDTYVGRNIGKSEHAGLEAVIEKSVLRYSQNSLFYMSDYRVVFNWQSNKFGSFVADGFNYRGNKLPGVPDRRVFALVNFKIKDWFFMEPEIFMNGDMPMNDSNSLFYKANSIVNLRFGWTFQNSKFDFRLSSAVNNLFNAKYASMILINAPSAGNRPPRYYYPGLPLNYALSLSIGIKA